MVSVLRLDEGKEDTIRRAGSRRSRSAAAPGARGRSGARPLCRKHGSSEPTGSRWKQQDGGLAIRAARRLKALAEETSRLKRLVAE
jgi:hypothetical protein